jgi:hypothetical protein
MRTLRDWLASRLAGFYDGENVLDARCFGKEEKECRVYMGHNAGEVVYSLAIYFKARNDKVQMDSLVCHYLP